MTQTNGHPFPLVPPNDDGIRPAGKPDECFYCQGKVGERHGPDCVCVKKRVKVRYSFEFEIEVPHSWDQNMVEFHRNESSWYAGNAIGELEKAFPEGGSECPCGSFRCEFLEVTDATPRGKEST